MVDIELAPGEGAQRRHYEGDPRDIIELTHDIYKPSVTWTELSQAIEKDMVLSNLSLLDMKMIRAEFSLIETLSALYRRDPVKYRGLLNTINDEITTVANHATITRGADGFTAKLMRKTIQEQHSTMGHQMANEKQREGPVGKRKNFLGF